MATTVLQRRLLPLLNFLLDDWLDAESLLQRDRFKAHTTETLRSVLEAASDMAAEYFEPAARTSDLDEPRMENGTAIVPESSHRAWAAYRDFGFPAAMHDEAYGGMQLPRTYAMALRVIFEASAANLFPALLTDHNAALLLHHGIPAQRVAFAVPQITGRWSGTMSMSETQAGSSLGDVTTRAVPDGDDAAADPLGARYRLSGSKMWISGGEHDLTDNIVHLVLARTADQAGQWLPGTKGLSLFVVPKILPDGQRNDIALVGLNHKLGARGVPNTVLAFGDGATTPSGAPGAVGYRVGAAGDGLRQMFHMMNAVRIEIGVLAAALGVAGYAVSSDYARERRQGRPTDRSAPSQVPIIEHADVKRMLLAQKAYAEGSLALALYAARLADETDTASEPGRTSAQVLLDLLTPVVKSWPSEWCLEANSLAIQVLGGAGYTRDFPVEMYWRDQRLNMIHRGYPRHPGNRPAEPTGRRRRRAGSGRVGCPGPGHGGRGVGDRLRARGRRAGRSVDPPGVRHEIRTRTCQPGGRAAQRNAVPARFRTGCPGLDLAGYRYRSESFILDRSPGQGGRHALLLRLRTPPPHCIARPGRVRRDIVPGRAGRTALTSERSTNTMIELGKRFSGRTALITGASRGIGLAVAERIVAEGGRVVITARKIDALQQAVEAFGGPDVAVAAAGASDDPDHIDAAIAQALSSFGRLDVLVNNTGINPVHGPLRDIDDAAARKIFEVNVLAALKWANRACAAGLGKDGGGAIVNMASVAGLSASPGIAWYGVTKSALIGLTAQLAYELAPQVRVNAVAPAVVKTKFAAALYEADEAGAAAQYPLARLGSPEDIAAAAAFLASSDAAWITGHTLVVDGGAGLNPLL
jgi:butyryl-CoA dehydrogenase